MQSEAVVDTGPAVFISPSGPNPLMVQAIFSISLHKVFFFLEKEIILIFSIFAD